MEHPIDRVRAFEIAGAYTLRVSFDDGTEQIIDFQPILARELYGPLQDVSLFNQVQGAKQGIPNDPIHQALRVWMGVGIVENLDLEQLVETARRLRRYEFRMTFAPIPVEGGTGSPLTPLAIF